MWKHNTFEKLVESKSDFTGMVAYTIYKNDKLSWINDQKNKNDEYPSQNIIDEYFHSSAESEPSIERYKEQAVSIVNRFISATISEEMDNYKNQVRDETIIEAVTPSWRKRILDGVIITIVTTSIVTFTTNLYWFNNKIQESKDREAYLEKHAVPKELIELLNNPPKKDSEN